MKSELAASKVCQLKFVTSVHFSSSCQVAIIAHKEHGRIQQQLGDADRSFHGQMNRQEGT